MPILISGAETWVWTEIHGTTSENITYEGGTNMDAAKGK
jgi:hypothetical protein